MYKKAYIVNQQKCMAIWVKMAQFSVLKILLMINITETCHTCNEGNIKYVNGNCSGNE